MKAHRELVFNFVIAMSLITLLSLAEGRANESEAHFSNFENESSSLQRGWKSRRLLQERQAPRGFPPPDGNALVHNPRERTPPSKWPRIPDDPPPLKIPPPQPMCAWSGTLELGGGRVVHFDKCLVYRRIDNDMLGMCDWWATVNEDKCAGYPQDLVLEKVIEKVIEKDRGDENDDLNGNPPPPN